MIHHFTAIKACVSGIAGLFAAAGAVVLDERTHVPLGAALGVLVPVCGVVWWIGTKLQSNTDAIDDLKSHVAKLSDRMDAIPCANSHPDRECHIAKKS